MDAITLPDDAIAPHRVDVAGPDSVAVPMRRYATAQDVAAATAFLSSADASDMTGDVLAVDGGVLAGGLIRR